MRSNPAVGRGRDYLGLAGFMALSLAWVALNGCATAQGVRDWYPAIAKPSFTPPDWLFGPVWTTIFVLMAVAAWRVWRLPPAPPRTRALALFGVQLALNLLWSVLFFTLRSPPAALADIAALWLLILATLLSFHRLDRPAGLLLVPYILWVSLAVALNVGIVRLAVDRASG
jgi:tryptophan-rich sensory protein